MYTLVRLAMFSYIYKLFMNSPPPPTECLKCSTQTPTGKGHHESQTGLVYYLYIPILAMDMTVKAFRIQVQFIVRECFRFGYKFNRLCCIRNKLCVLLYYIDIK